MRTTTQKAYAKINIGLDVLRRLENGYHEVKMIMQTVNLCDDLIFEKLEEPGIILEIDNMELPTNQDNLIYRTAELMMEEKRISDGVRIRLTKRIPIAAGMAGGSSDAAATFRGLNELFELGYTTKELQELGVRLGADIPYCIVGGTMLSEGIGEILSPLPSPPACQLVIAKPDINVSTKFVYENLHADSLKEHPDIDGMIAAMQAGDLQGIADRMGNVLETVTVKEYPVIRTIKECCMQEGALNALMSGSGPTVFALYDSREKAAMAAEVIRNKKLATQVYVTDYWNPERT